MTGLLIYNGRNAQSYNDVNKRRRTDFAVFQCRTDDNRRNRISVQAVYGRADANFEHAGAIWPDTTDDRQKIYQSRLRCSFWEKHL